jgi:hypothetical protein
MKQRRKKNKLLKIKKKREIDIRVLPIFSDNQINYIRIIMQERNTHYCSNCQITIPNDSEYQAHYRSDFHRYNIRRRLMNLESVSFDVFQKSIFLIL